MRIKLITDAEQHRKLLETMKRFNEACNEISRVAFENKTFSKVKIQKLCYYDIREKFGLSAQMVVRAIGKVAEHHSWAFYQLRQFIQYKLRRQEFLYSWLIQETQVAPVLNVDM
jgi:predicted transposase